MCVECNYRDNILYVPLSPSINLKHLNLKTELIVDKHMKPGVYPSWMQINWQPQDSTSQTRVILFVAFFVERK